MSRAAELAEWAISSPLIDGVLFSPGAAEGAPICAVAQAQGFRGFGKGMTQDAALWSALGEAIELYAAAQIPRDRLIRASFRDIEAEAFDPRWLCLYTDEQYKRPGFPYQPFREDTPVHWIRGRWADSGAAVYTPASATFLSEELAAEAFCQTTSNGLGAGTNLAEAGERATLELRERDAFITSWISCRGAVRVQTGPDNETFRQVSSTLQRAGAQLETYLVADQQPVFVAVSVGLGDGVNWPSVTLGLGAGPTAGAAMNKAVLEHGQTGPYLAEQWKSGAAEIPNSAEAIHTLEHQALFYCDPKNRPHFDAWRNSAIERPADRAPDDFRIAVADLTPPALAESPFRVARALAFGLQPLHVGFGMERRYTRKLTKMLENRRPHTAPLPVC